MGSSSGYVPRLMFSGRFSSLALAPKRFRKLDESGQVDGQLVPVSLLVTQLTHPAYQSGSLPEVSLGIRVLEEASRLYAFSVYPVHT